MTYQPPPVPVTAVSIGTTAGGVIKKKKAFIPGYAGMRSVSDFDSRSVASSNQRREMSTDEGLHTPVEEVETTHRVEPPEQPSPEQVENGEDAKEVEVIPQDPLSVEENIIEEEAKPDVAGPETSGIDEAPDGRVIVEGIETEEYKSSMMDLIEMESKFLAEKLKLKEDLSDLIVAQNKFCQEEKFEEADNLENKIELIKSEIFGINHELLVSIPRKVSSFREQRLEKIVGVKASLEREYKEAKTAHEKQECSSLKTIKELKSSLDLSRIVEEKFKDDRLNVSKLRDDFEAKRKHLKEEVSVQSQEICHGKEIAQIEYEEVDQLINDLQKQLTEAMEKRSALAMKISGLEIELKSIEFTHSANDQEEETELIRLENELRDKIVAEGGCEDLEKLKMELEQFEESLESDRQREIKLEERFASRKTEIEIGIGILQVHDRKPNSVNAMIECQELYEFLREDLKNMELHLETFKDETVVLRDKKLPELEEAKRGAIQSRSFKEAKELSDEIKVIQDRLDATDVKVVEFKSKIKTARNQFNEALSARDEIMKRIDDEIETARKWEIEALHKQIFEIQEKIDQGVSSLGTELDISKQRLGVLETL
jgi:hypothetical protein